jgi:hypothetical protein
MHHERLVQMLFLAFARLNPKTTVPLLLEGWVLTALVVECDDQSCTVQQDPSRDARISTLKLTARPSPSASLYPISTNAGKKVRRKCVCNANKSTPLRLASLRYFLSGLLTAANHFPF